MLWQQFLDWLPDLKIGILEVRDVLNLGVGVVFGYYAYALGKKQTEIAEKQDLLLDEQRSRKANLTMRVNGWSAGLVDGDESQRYRENRLVIVNDGNKPARDIHFRILVPFLANYEPSVTLCVGNTDLGIKEVSGDENEPFVELRGICPGPIYSGQWFECATIYVQVPAAIYKDHKLTECEYELRWEDGRVPTAGGLEVLSLRSLIQFSPSTSPVQASTS